VKLIYKDAMNADNVAAFLQANPDFFKAHAELLIDLVIPHPHGGRTISLSERQLIMLRERVKDLEKKLLDWMDIARENEALQNKVHQYSLTLFGTRDLDTLQERAARNLRDIFAIPEVAIHLWKVDAPSAEVMAFADQHSKPVCAHQPVHYTQLWFGEQAAHLRSFAYLPLRNETQSIGLLVMASEDGQRFYPEMGTVFLQRVAEIVSSAAQPHL
jgi:uncharacterized protein